MKNLRPLPPNAPRCTDGFVSPFGITVAYTKDWAKQHPAEDDGLCAALYQYLHKNIKGREHMMESLYLPDTVVFDHNFPRAWYTYDMKNREMTKQPSSMLDAQTMYECFKQSDKGCDIVAQFFHNTVNAGEEWRGVLHRKQGEDQHSQLYADDLLTYIEFFTAESLQRFLFDQKRKPDGVLQKFVVPRGDGSSRRNVQLQVLWTPHLTMVYRRTNRHKLNDRVVQMPDRAATFDGAPYLSEETLVADETKDKVTKLCNDIADHFYSTEKKRLSRLVVYFKTDDENRTWLLWSSCLRVAPDALNPSTMQLPVCLHMRTEVLNDGGSTIARLQGRRTRQRQLLDLDAELFEATQDFKFALSMNTAHTQQCKMLGLGGRATGKQPTRVCGGKRVPVSKKHPLYNSYALLQDENLQLAHGRPSNLSRVGDAAALASAVSPSLQQDEVDLDEDVTPYGPLTMVREELVGLAMDLWYAAYSSLLADDPHVMPTAHMEMAAPLVDLLTAGELEELVDTLGLRPSSKSDGTNHYFIAPHLITSGRRLDRPSSRVEQDLVAFFSQLFQQRGEEIAQLCLEKYSSYF